MDLRFTRSMRVEEFRLTVKKKAGKKSRQGFRWCCTPLELQIEWAGSLGERSARGCIWQHALQTGTRATQCQDRRTSFQGGHNRRQTSHTSAQTSRNSQQGELCCGYAGLKTGCNVVIPWPWLLPAYLQPDLISGHHSPPPPTSRPLLPPLPKSQILLHPWLSK